jgi:hypothetical protein
MIIFHCTVIEKPEDAHFISGLEGVDMENVDYKRQPEINFVSEMVAAHGGTLCGILRGGMFGLSTNQIWALSAWEHADAIDSYATAIESDSNYRLTEQGHFHTTVRPNEPEVIDYDGIYVIRWIRMLTSDIEEYTKLCLETWPRFETNSQARCYGIFRPVEHSKVSKMLMLTWYASLDDWEKSRQLDQADAEKWARRSEMELSHWAQVGRLA